MENNTFKGAMFGGFKRQDVLDYIEKSAKDNADALEKANSEAAALRGELERANSRLDELESENATVKLARDNLQSKMFDVSAELEDAKTALAEKTAALAALKEKTDQLSAKVAELEPEVEKYHELRGGIADVELAAKKRAEDAVERAKAQADAILAEAAESAEATRLHAEQKAQTVHRGLEETMASCRAQYKNLYSEFEVTAAHIGGELGRMQQTCAGFPKLFEKLGADVAKLAELLGKEDK